MARCRCQGRCKDYPRRPNGTASPYETHFFCTVCLRWIPHELATTTQYYCPCCNNKLRTRPRDALDKRRTCTMPRLSV